jgi:hypothetical protein
MSIKKTGFAFVVVGAALRAGLALAACDVDFDNAPAKGLTTSMVRAYWPCPGTRGPAGIFPNNETEGETGACSPVSPKQSADGFATSYSYAPNGTCTIKLSSKLARDCSSVDGADGTSLGLPAGACHVTSVKGKCSGISDFAGELIGSLDPWWTLRIIVRASIDDEIDGSMTVIDLPLTFSFEAPANGSMKVSGVSAEPLQDLGVLLPPCTILQVVDMTIKDPYGLPFAKMGGATIPKAP